MRYSILPLTEYSGSTACLKSKFSQTHNSAPLRVKFDTGEEACRLYSCSFLFCSLAILHPRVGHTMNVLSPFISVLCHSDWLFHNQSCPYLLRCPSRLCMVFLACVHLALSPVLSLSPGNSLVFSWCDHSMLASLLWQSLIVPFLCWGSPHLFSLLSTKLAAMSLILSPERRQNVFRHSF